jgi:hypothetical protein
MSEYDLQDLHQGCGESLRSRYVEPDHRDLVEAATGDDGEKGPALNRAWREWPSPRRVREQWGGNR